MEGRQSSLKNILTRNLPGINLTQISVVEDENADQYRSRYFAFIKGIPGEQSSDSPTGRTYNYKGGINLKVEAEKIYAMASALRICAEGKYEPYEKNFGQFEIFADSSKSSFGEGGKKNVKIGVMQNNKTGKFVITLSFLADNKKSIAYLSPYDAFGFAKVLEFCADKILTLESEKQTGFVVKNEQTQQKPQMQPADNQADSSQSNQQNGALNNFRQMFNDQGMGGMDEPPF